MRNVLVAATIAAMSWPALAETIQVKYEGAVDLGTYECQVVTRSSLVNRVCYDETAGFMIVLLKSTYYAYCGVPAQLVADFYAAKSVGHFYNQRIKSDAVEGRYACED